MMTDSNQKSPHEIVFHGFDAPEPGTVLVGYAALIVRHQLAVPTPDNLCAIGSRHRTVVKGRWRLFTPRHKPQDTLQGHLTFAFKYEGIDLAVCKALFLGIDPEEIVEIVLAQPTGAYSRRIWFLYEWLCNATLPLDDSTRGNFVPLLNDALQYPGPSRNSKRHRVRNNLPGTRDFCPLIRRTGKLEEYIGMDLSKAAMDQIGTTPSGLLNRAAAFLLLKDSKATYTIEGETPPHTRIERWGRILNESGQRALTVEELEYLQMFVIAEGRFVTLGLRTEGGFVGDHERATGMPIPAHISARPDDLRALLAGLIGTVQLLKDSDFDAVLMAAVVAFGFVFIHPFEDGNGRIHRYLFHHVLATRGFVPKGVIFPVSAVILDRIEEYRLVLEQYSKPRLSLIKWRPTETNNVEVQNETIDLYRYFDATLQAEFLFTCIEEAVNRALPEEVRYLTRYDALCGFIKNYIDLPDRLIDLLIRFLSQNDGRLSNRARRKEFRHLTDREIQVIEDKYRDVFDT